MPIYEGIGMVTEKNSVVFDFGRAYTKCGFAREPSPRWIIPSSVPLGRNNQMQPIWNYWAQDDLTTMLKEFMYTLYFRHLSVNPKDRRVVVVESVLCPTLFRNTVAQVLFEHFEVPAIVFVPSHLMALYTLGINSALVLDCGYYESISLPVYEGVCILSAWQAIPLGGLAIHRRIESELMELATVRGSSDGEFSLAEVLTDPIRESVLEDIKVRTCFVTTRERALKLQVWGFARSNNAEVIPDPPPPPPEVKYPLDGDKIITIPGSLREYAAEALFELDGDMKSIATLLLDSILKAPMDSRKVLAQNIVVMGGSSMMPGFKHRLLQELKSLVQDPTYSRKMNMNTFKFHSPPSKENYTAWLGASIYGSTDAVNVHCITKDQFITNNRHIPDWSDQAWQALSSKTA
ncbi:actin-related protein 10-like [Dermacentor albipictus]|uniref:actin-related protein 10-like n=1 Tax=Dermacentor albipictus TaxID=60249 RepID=UPI0038FC559A